MCREGIIHRERIKFSFVDKNEPSKKLHIMEEVLSKENINN